MPPSPPRIPMSCSSAHLRPAAEGPGDLPCRRQGARRRWPRRRSGIISTLSGLSRRGCRHRHHPPRPRRADAPDQGDRGRPSRARRSRPEGRRREAAAGRDSRRRRSAAGAAVGRRLGELDRAGRGRVVRAEAAGRRGRCCARARRSARSTPCASICRGSRAAGWRAPASRAEIVTLAISDVPHDDPSAIASGPTVPDPTTLADARAIVAKYGLAVDDAVRARSTIPHNESCKPGDAAFARAHFELIARPQGIARRRDQARQGRRLRDHRSRRRSRRRGPRRRRRSRPAGVAGARRRQARRDPVRRRTHGDGARQRPRRPQPGICAGAGRACSRTRRAFRRWPPIPTAPMAAPAAPTDPAGAIIDATTFAKMKSLGLDPQGLSRQQRRHRVFRRDRRSVADRPDADQRQRYQGDFGGCRAVTPDAVRALRASRAIPVPAAHPSRCPARTFETAMRAG